MYNWHPYEFQALVCGFLTGAIMFGIPLFRLSRELKRRENLDKLLNSVPWDAEK